MVLDLHKAWYRGLLNEIAPDLGELCGEPAPRELVALCYSRSCAGKAAEASVEIGEAGRRDSWCPRCGSALVWTNPGLKGKRKLRGRA